MTSEQKNLDFRMTMGPADSTLRKNADPSHKKSGFQAMYLGAEGGGKKFRHLLYP
jgi:hypothetical protein